MYIKKTKQKNNRIRLDVVENYYDSEKKISKQITLKSIGYIDELEKEHKDPVAYYKNMILAYKEFIKDSPYPIALKFKANEKMTDMSLYERNFGFIVLSKIYHGLEIHKFLKNRQRHRNDNFNADELFKTLLNIQIVTKYDRTSWFQKKRNYTESELKEFFKFIHNNSFQMMKWINKHISSYYDRGTCYIYENIGEFNFTEKKTATLTINRNNRYNQTRNSSYLSIYLDSSGVPYAFREVNKYNHLEDPKKFYAQLKEEMDIKNFVIVGDRTEESYEDINKRILANPKTRYIFAIDPIKTPDEVQNFILDKSGLKKYNDKTYYKTQNYIRNLSKDGKNKVVLEKHMLIINDTKKINDKLKRENLIFKASRFIENAQYYHAQHIGSEIEYIKKVVFNPNGTIDLENSILELNQEKIKKEEQFDGVKYIITNDPKSSLARIINIYYYQYSLEQVLQNIKCTMNRPSEFFTPEEYSHYTNTTCLTTFMSLILIRLLYLAMNKKYTLPELLEAINKYNCILIQQNYYLFTYYDNIIDDIGERMNIDLNVRIRTLKEIRQIFAQIKKTDFTDTDQTKPAS